VLGGTGLLVLLNPTALDWGAPKVLIGSGLLLLDAVIWAATTIQLRNHRWRSTPFALQPWELLLAFLPLALLALLFDGGRGIEWTPQTIFVILYSGPLATGFAYWASQSVSRALSPIETTTSLLAVPVVGLLSGAIVLGESLSTADLVGFAIVALGIVGTSVPWPVRAGGRASQAAPRTKRAALEPAGRKEARSRR